MATHKQTKDVLICIPCFNSEGEIEQVVRPLLQYSNAHVLLIDDHSEQPLQAFIEQRFKYHMHRITVLRPDSKVYSGGAKNIGMRRALSEGYRTVILLDSDIVVPEHFVFCIRQYFLSNPRQVVVAPAIQPHGTRCQYVDTLINFSTYLPENEREVSYKTCLAGYAFALNLQVFRQHPCFHDERYGGEDVLFFHQLMSTFGLEGLPVLNRVPVLHLPPRKTLRQVFAAQRRYGRAFFTHNNRRREYLFTKIPLLHLFTPRFYLMCVRLLRRRRFNDLAYLPWCWCLDLTRAVQIVRLSLVGHRDPSS